MTDWPGVAALPLGAHRHVYSTVDPSLLCGEHGYHIANMTTGGTWPSNNLGIFCGFTIREPETAYQMSCEVTTQSGNLDLGIYDESFTRKVALGSTAVGAAGIQVANITDTPLAPGYYYMAMACSTTVAAFIRNTMNADILRVSGVFQVSSQIPLAAGPVTPAAYGQSYLPFIAVHTYATTV